jgi:putative holliday junction resolvase
MPILFLGILSLLLSKTRKKNRSLLGRIAGIDFGTVRIGLAISDEMRIIAQSLETIKASSDPMQTVRLIAHALSRYKNIDTIVIGLPLLLNGKEGEMAQLVRAFAKNLEQVLPFPILFWDERLTSSGVEKMLIESDISRKKRAELSDALSAVSILQNYLDSLRNRL